MGNCTYTAEFYTWTGFGTGFHRRESCSTTLVLLHLLWQIFPVIYVVQPVVSQTNCSLRSDSLYFVFDYSMGYRTALNGAANHSRQNNTVAQVPWESHLILLPQQRSPDRTVCILIHLTRGSEIPLLFSLGSYKLTHLPELPSARCFSVIIGRAGAKVQLHANTFTYLQIMNR